MSHLLQMRGLKPVRTDGENFFILSHLLQMRGLKPYKLMDKALEQVASFTDAWIETKKSASVIRIALSHLLQMRGLKLIA